MGDNRIPGSVGKSPPVIDDGSVCRVPSPLPGSLGRQRDTSKMSLEDRFAEVMRRALPKLPAEMREEFAALLEPEALAIIVGVLAVWAASHYFGVGFVVDLILIVGGVFLLGWQLWEAGKDLVAFVQITRDARTEADLEMASHHLANFVAVVGVAAFIALIAKGIAKRTKLPTKRPPKTKWWEVLDESADLIPGASIPNKMRIRVGKRVWNIECDALKTGFKSGQPKGPTTKHLGEVAKDANPWAKVDQVDYPISALAGALEQADRQLVKMAPSKAAKPKNIDGWELVVDTTVKPWRVEHALPTDAPKW